MSDHTTITFSDGYHISYPTALPEGAIVKSLEIQGKLWLRFGPFLVRTKDCEASYCGGGYDEPLLQPCDECGGSGKVPDLDGLEKHIALGVALGMQLVAPPKVAVLEWYEALGKGVDAVLSAIKEAG